MPSRRDNFFNTTEKYDNNSGKKGVYRLLNLKNNKYYIGSARRSFSKRISEHLSTAFTRADSQNYKKTSHRPLYRAIRKYGSENFLVDILWIFPEESSEEVLKEKLDAIIIAKEQEYLDKYFSDELCYNLSDRADKPSGTVIDGGYIVTYPDGKEEACSCLSEWCAEHNMPYHAFSGIARGEQVHYENYTVRFAKEEYQLECTKKDVRKVIFDPSGKRYVVSNMIEFAKEHLPEVSSDVAQSGFIRSCQNGTLYKNFQVYEFSQAPKTAKPLEFFEPILFVLYSPEGKERYDVVNLSEFCREHGLSNADRINLLNCAQQKRHQVKGWTCYYPENEPESWIDPRELAGLKKFILYNPTTNELLEIYNEKSEFKKLNLNGNAVYKAADPKYSGNKVKGYYCYEKEDFPGTNYIDNLPENIKWKIETREEDAPSIGFTFIGNIEQCVEWILTHTSISKANAKRCWNRNKGKESFTYLNLNIEKYS